MAPATAAMAWSVQIAHCMRSGRRLPSGVPRGMLGSIGIAWSTFLGVRREGPRCTGAPRCLCYCWSCRRLATGSASNPLRGQEVGGQGSEVRPTKGGGLRRALRDGLVQAQSKPVPGEKLPAPRGRLGPRPRRRPLLSYGCQTPRPSPRSVRPTAGHARDRRRSVFVARPDAARPATRQHDRQA